MFNRTSVYVYRQNRHTPFTNVRHMSNVSQVNIGMCRVEHNNHNLQNTNLESI